MTTLLIASIAAFAGLVVGLWLSHKFGPVSIWWQRLKNRFTKTDWLD